MVIVNDILVGQLSELARAFNRHGIKPIICGGLGIYLCFHNRTGEARGLIRATNDIDLMLTKSHILDQSCAHATAEIITGELRYVAREDCRHFRFKRIPNQELDVLAQPVDGRIIGDNRVRIVKSKLHGRLTNEAVFIHEDLQTIKLADAFPTSDVDGNLEVQVPSLTNFLILKICAFNDRDEGVRNNIARVQTHALDIYIILMLAKRDDFKEGRNFLARHADSEQIQKVQSIVANKFDSIDQRGWQCVLGTAGFHAGHTIEQRRKKLEDARSRLVRWFQ